MTIEQITKEAEEKYPIDKRYHTLTDQRWIDAERKAYIAGAMAYSKKLEEIMEEVQQRMRRFQHHSDDCGASQYHEAREILSIIDKHLNHGV